MVVRIRLERPRLLERSKWRLIAITIAALLTPCALIAFSMAFWIFAADMQWSPAFFITSGLFSRWEIWLALAAILLLMARVLDKVSQTYSPRGKRAAT